MREVERRDLDSSSRSGLVSSGAAMDGAELRRLIQVAIFTYRTNY
jgi:hypothetical protein